MKRLTLLLLAILMSITLFACNQKPLINPNEDFCVEGRNEGVFVCEKRFTSYFDTIISLKIYYDKDSNYDLDEVYQEFLELTEKFHQYFDKYNEYEGVNNIYTINNSNEPVMVDLELFEAVEYALENDDLLTDGDTLLFNIALDPVLQIWHNARGSSLCDPFIEFGTDYCPVPTSELEDKTFNVNPDDILMDRENLTIGFSKDNMGIDLGGFAKGYVTDKIASYLNQYNINYILNLGNSNVYVNGINVDREDGAYYIALTKPFAAFNDPQPYYGIVKLTNGLHLVSSGSYQRYFKNINDYSDEKIYHHIIDPRTNYPGGDFPSVTILYNSGTKGDILSTILFLLSVEEGLEYVNNNDDLEASWYLGADNIVMSDGFADYLLDLN